MQVLWLALWHKIILCLITGKTIPGLRRAQTTREKTLKKDYQKENDFIGKKAVLEQKKNPPLRKLCAFEVDANEADVTSYEPIFKDDKVIGFCTSVDTRIILKNL